MMVSVSVGVCVYNEGRNIERALRSVYSQTTDGFTINEVIVVSSGSTDDTDRIVERLMTEFQSLKLIRQETRMGKNSAINEFLEAKSGDVCALLNGDNVLGNDLSLFSLVSPFNDESVGMTGGRPVPTNDPGSLAGFATHLIWSMHHHVSMIRPKIGELVAFRDIGTRLPTTMQSDEDIIKMELEKNGYRSVYSPGAIVLNHGPETVSDFIKQRVRVNIGEEYMRRKFEYSVPTWDKRLLASAIISAVRDLGIRPVKMPFAVLMEMISRSKAKAHVSAGKGDMNVWSPVDSTKDLK
jgi:cellulose synthase/poly-beta-1,6-N-acetylglucosamine synthase-like glycosyltransferase